MATPARIYTRAEKTQRARLLIKGAKGAYGDTSANERQIDRIDAAAEDRAAREHAAHQRLLESAKNDLAAAKVQERAASRRDRQTARETRKAAEKRLRDAERAAR